MPHYHDKASALAAATRHALARRAALRATGRPVPVAERDAADTAVQSARQAEADYWAAKIPTNPTHRTRP